MSITLRAAKAEDESYVFATWCDSWWSAQPDGIKARAWRDAVGETVADSLRAHKLVVACSDEDPDMLYGFACGHPGRLLYVYVTNTRRRMGLGTRLVQAVCGERVEECATMTPDGVMIAARKGVRWKP